MQGRLAASAKSTSSAWDLLLAITVRDLRVKYHGTVLSYFWWLARPLTLGLVLYFALGRVLKLDVPHHAIFLLSALFPWFWFQGTLHAATGAFIANEGLLKKVQFPRAILPLSVVLGGTFEFAVTLPVLMILVVANGITPSWTWLIGVPLLLGLQLVLLAGLGTVVSCLNVFFRDIGPGIEAAMTLLFYMSPIIYPLDKVPGGIKPVMQLNPLVPLLEAWRALFIDGELPGLDIWPAALFAAGAVAAGAWVLRTVGKNLADAL
jgi:ABC-type polysaccharide/polyol phosphate export permease